jgi:hypothetical protein
MNKEAPTGHAERRRNARVRDARPVYVRPAENDGEPFEEVRTMDNFSEGGFYFITHRDYRKGMHLHAIPEFGCVNFEYEGEVVRVEALACGESGVAVRLLRIRSMPLASGSSPRQSWNALPGHRSIPSCVGVRPRDQ